MLYDEPFLARLAAGLASLLPVWDFGPEAHLSLMTVSENATFRVRQDGRDRVLRVHRPDYHGEAEILSELAWIDALRREGVVETPRIASALDGSLLQSFPDGETRRFVVAFDYMEGHEPDAADDLARWYRELGGISARLHDHSRRWVRPPGFARKVWDFDHILGEKALWGDWRDALGLTPEGRTVLERAHAALEARTAAYGYGAERFGLVHCDMRTANLLAEGNRLGVIDFDDCGFSWFAYDFAAAVSFMEHEPFVPELMAAWLEGYRAVTPFSAEDEAALPMLVMLRRMQLTAWIATHAETPTAASLGAGYTEGTVALAEAFLGSV